MVTGLILEINPLHNGHIKLINYCKNTLKSDTLIACVSQSFSMRGKVSPLSKKEKTRLLLKAGIDLIFELPSCYAIKYADEFAKNAVFTLNELHVDNICCGSLITDIKILDKIYKLSKETFFLNKLNEIKINNHVSLKTAYNIILKDYLDTDTLNKFNHSNTILAYSYYKVIKDYNLNIDLVLIERIDDNKSYLSATSLCEMIKDNLDISKYIPFPCEVNNLNTGINTLNSIIISKKELFNTSDDNTIKSYINKCITNYIQSKSDSILIPTKEYSLSYIRREILSVLLNINNIDYIPYLRLLGGSKIGFNYIKNLDKLIKDMIFSNPNELNYQNIILNKELDTIILYQSLFNRNDLLMDEYKFPLKEE